MKYMAGLLIVASVALNGCSDKASPAAQTSTTASTVDRTVEMGSRISALETQVTALQTAIAGMNQNPLAARLNQLQSDIQARLTELDVLVGHGSNFTGVRGCVRAILTELGKGANARTPLDPSCNAIFA
jgi:hypothetical protein